MHFTPTNTTIRYALGQEGTKEEPSLTILLPLTGSCRSRSVASLARRRWCSRQGFLQGWFRAADEQEGGFVDSFSQVCCSQHMHACITTYPYPLIPWNQGNKKAANHWAPTTVSAPSPRTRSARPTAPSCSSTIPIVAAALTWPPRSTRPRSSWRRPSKRGFPSHDDGSAV